MAEACLLWAQSEELLKSDCLQAKTPCNRLFRVERMCYVECYVQSAAWVLQRQRRALKWRISEDSAGVGLEVAESKADSGCPDRKCPYQRPGEGRVREPEGETDSGR